MRLVALWRECRGVVRRSRNRKPATRGVVSYPRNCLGPRLAHWRARSPQQEARPPGGRRTTMKATTRILLGASGALLSISGAAATLSAQQTLEPVRVTANAAADKLH